MKFTFTKLVSIFTFILFSSLFAQFDYQTNYYQYNVIVDLGSDNYDPLFSKESVVEIIKERMNKWLPSYSFDYNTQNVPVVIVCNLLTISSNELGSYRYVTTLNLLISTNSQVSLNHVSLIIDNNDERMKAKIREYIDKWILEYSSYSYKILNK